jgi:hypothetical protein
MSGSQDALERLAAVLESRRGGDPAVSYVARLFAKAPDAILKKIGEEATETVMAAKDGDPAKRRLRDCRSVVPLPGDAGPLRPAAGVMSSPNSNAAKGFPGLPRRAPKPAEADHEHACPTASSAASPVARLRRARSTKTTRLMAFHDIQPIAPVHFLVIPKIHVDNLYDGDLQHQQVLGRMLGITGQLAAAQGLRPTAFGSSINNGTGWAGRRCIIFTSTFSVGRQPLGSGMPRRQ